MNDTVSLARWREWARFVFLNGDQAARTDDELRDLVCESWDAEARSHAKLHELLARTCDALKGRHPDPLKLHSFHDLPEVAERLRAENEALRRDATMRSQP